MGWFRSVSIEQAVFAQRLVEALVAEAGACCRVGIWVSAQTFLFLFFAGGMFFFWGGGLHLEVGLKTKPTGIRVYFGAPLFTSFLWR